MYSAFIPDCGYDTRTIILIGDVYCPNTKCLGKLCLHKKTFQSLGRSDYQCPQCASVCGTHCFAKKSSRDYEKEKPSPFSMKFLRQSQPSTSEREPKENKSSPNIE